MLLQDGLLSNYETWFTQNVDNSPPFIYAQAGFDVWFGNSRGNSFSQRHIRDDTSDKEFWNFSQYEMGIYDLPVMLDYITNLTKQEKITYI